MNFTSQAVIALAVSTCGNTGSNQSSSSSSGYELSCSDYQFMIDVELDLADDCSSDS